VKLYPTIISVNKPFTIVVKGNAINETWKQINFNVYAKFGDKVILLNDTSNGIDQKIYGNVILNIDSPDFNKKDMTLQFIDIKLRQRRLNLKVKFKSYENSMESGLLLKVNIEILKSDSEIYESDFTNINFKKHIMTGTLEPTDLIKI